MIRQTINGRKALLVYLDAEFNPVDKEAAQLIKIIFDDGERMFVDIKAGALKNGDPQH